jgi:hypothetical protein
LRHLVYRGTASGEYRDPVAAIYAVVAKGVGANDDWFELAAAYQGDAAFIKASPTRSRRSFMRRCFQLALTEQLPASPLAGEFPTMT